MVYLIMDLLWMVLPVFVVCAEAKNLTEVKVELGQNATLNCSVDKPMIYWYMEVHSHFIVRIADSFSSGTRHQNWIDNITDKLVVVPRNSLVIMNITADDCRLYYCAVREGDQIKFEEVFRVVSCVPMTPPTDDSKDKHQQQQHSLSLWQSAPVVYSSLSLNALLLVLIGSVSTFLCLKRKNHQLNDTSHFTDENLEMLERPQYEEIHLPPCRPSPPAECIYYKAQLPLSTPLPH
uniref:uncharacterized protein LOC124055256 n=1 Tax=Scatophagus argus TaxID=75038 RepID=UPI001ED82432|nr:uncharacterized protein LOC124055256 [Scatophagus argus]